MTTPDTYPSRVDASHVWSICAEAADRSAGMFVIPGENYGAQVSLPTRSAARASRDALARVGYQVTLGTASRRERGLTIYGWSAHGLDSRLKAMHGVLSKLGSERGWTAETVLDQLADLSLAALPDEAGRQGLIREAAHRLRGWISATSGIHAPCDPLARPADAACGFRLSATWRGEEAIDSLAGRQLQVAWHALAVYPGLRESRSHEAARESALRGAGITSSPGQQLAPGTTPLMRADDRGRRPAGPRHAASPRRPWNRLGPGEGPARIFPFPGSPDPGAVPRPPDGPSRLRGRNFPSGPAGRP